MSISAYSFTSLGARYFQPRIGLGSAFSRPRFDSPRPVAHPVLSNEPEQGVRIGAQIDAVCGPLGPQLHGMLEAQLPRMNVRIERRLCHQQADQVIGEQMNPQFLFDHPRREAAQDFNAQGGFDVAQQLRDIKPTNPIPPKSRFGIPITRSPVSAFR